MRQSLFLNRQLTVLLVDPALVFFFLFFFCPFSLGHKSSVVIKGFACLRVFWKWYHFYDFAAQASRKGLGTTAVLFIAHSCSRFPRSDFCHCLMTDGSLWLWFPLILRHCRQQRAVVSSHCVLAPSFSRAGPRSSMVFLICWVHNRFQ